MRKSKRKLTYKKELKKLYREYKKITNNAYTMRGYNRWKQKVIKLLRMVEDRESFVKYLEIKMNTTTTYNAIWGSIIGMVLAIMAGVTINVISGCDPDSVLEQVYDLFPWITITCIVILLVLIMVIHKNFNTDLKIMFYAELLNINKEHRFRPRQ